LSETQDEFRRYNLRKIKQRKENKMRFNFIIATSILFLSFGTSYVLASEGHNHSDDKESMDHGSMMKDEGMMQNEAKDSESKAAEVGNKICPVSGDKIPAPGENSAMGEVVKYEYKGKIYSLCCTMCVKDFKKDPEKYSKIAEEEVKNQQIQIDETTEGRMKNEQNHEQHHHDHGGK
jgi:YHS domain-containing protein